MPTITFEQDEETRAQILQIQRTLLEIKDAIKSLKAQNISVKSDGWLQASAFCRNNGISRPTLKNRVEQGLIEVRDFGERYPRYRWVQKRGQNEYLEET